MCCSRVVIANHALKAFHAYVPERVPEPDRLSCPAFSLPYLFSSIGPQVYADASRTSPAPGRRLLDSRDSRALTTLFHQHRPAIAFRTFGALSQ